MIVLDVQTWMIFRALVLVKVALMVIRMGSRKVLRLMKRMLRRRNSGKKKSGGQFPHFRNR